MHALETSRLLVITEYEATSRRLQINLRVKLQLAFLFLFYSESIFFDNYWRTLGRYM